MDISYNMESDLDWKNAESIDVIVPGWKGVRVKFIDAHPYLFWRLNDIERNFTSNSDLASRYGIHVLISDSLVSLKEMVTRTIDTMPEERKKFYKENIMEYAQSLYGTKIV